MLFLNSQVSNISEAPFVLFCFVYVYFVCIFFNVGVIEYISDYTNLSNTSTR